MITISIVAIFTWLLFIAGIIGMMFCGAMFVIIAFINGIIGSRSAKIEWEGWGALLGFFVCLALVCFTSPFHL